MTTMQERAAKVADERVEECNRLGLDKPYIMGRHDASLGISNDIRALSPDPTRAALEECVSAMERNEWRGATYRNECPECKRAPSAGHHETCGYAAALKTARALQGE